MGSRQSIPSPTGRTLLTPPSPSKTPLLSRRINSRTLLAPVAAFTMAMLLLLYTRTSIRAAKENAQRHRNADSGGQGLDLLNEDRRRHGLKEKVDGAGEGRLGSVGELAVEARKQVMGRGKEKGGEAGEAPARSRESEDKLKAAMRKRGDEE